LFNWGYKCLFVAKFSLNLNGPWLAPF
jgi:hypothetical protein